MISLLLQPEENLPYLIVVDEPELGLHPYALKVIASLLRAATRHTQVLVSTQSSAFLDNFESEDIVVVERKGEATEFSRPDTQKLDAWLEDYLLGEVWEKNVIVIGGRFANTVLKRHLASFGVYMQNPVLIAHARKKGKVHRGGGRNFAAMQNDINRFLKQEPGNELHHDDRPLCPA